MNKLKTTPKEHIDKRRLVKPFVNIHGSFGLMFCLSKLDTSLTTVNCCNVREIGGQRC